MRTGNPYQPAHQVRRDLVVPRINSKNQRIIDIAARSSSDPRDQSTAFVGRQFANGPGDFGKLGTGAGVMVKVRAVDLAHDHVATANARIRQVLAKRFMQAA